MKRWSLWIGVLLVPLGWSAAALGGMTGHMAGHMIAVAVAAPLIAWGLTGGTLDAAKAWPRTVTPLAMSLIELLVVWAWHAPAVRAAADASSLLLGLEQACFLIAGLLLWSAVLGTGRERRASGVGALLLTSMHMTLLGALVGLAPRPLYPHLSHDLPDQQLGGVVMLLVGAASYFIGALAMLATLLRNAEDARA